ncbi:hypothetical protein [Flavobacterium sp. N1994]|uniref:hypothetical protein n=1 Tax=Flavobacterium sp. N1994 TaxID=2986827 RepID=UPI00222286DD|nr:hypothetical protein [Flavobacterium sp. N1994]
MKKGNFTIFLLLFAEFCLAQNYILPNEDLIFSFPTKNGKKMVLAKDKNNAYIIYRFGTANNIELEYPEKNKESWNKFTYSYYFRGGGIQNAGMEITSIFFKIGNFDYLIYDDYYSESDELTTGILVTNLTTNKETDIKGNYDKIEGTLYDIRQSGLLKMDDRIR